jgi:hypothetical protein
MTALGLGRLTCDFFHLKKGLLVFNEDNAALEIAMKEDSPSPRTIAGQVISLVWPSSTASTLISLPGIDAWQSEFHQKRLQIASGGCTHIGTFLKSFQIFFFF